MGFSTNLQKIQTTYFIGKLSLSTSCKFFYDDIKVDVIQESMPKRRAFCYSFSVEDKFF